MTWEPELEELRRREELARRMGGEERVARQHTSGRLTVRERIDRLFDAGTFRETGAIAGQATYEDGELADFLPANMVVGQGRVNGRRLVVQGDDFTVRGGASIHVENSHKYGPRGARLLLLAGGWTPVAEWSDPEDDFSIILAEAQPERFAP